MFERPTPSILASVLATFIAVQAVAVSGLSRCLDEAAKRFDHDPKIMRALLLVESSGNCNAVNMNDNGSYDVGCMQINSGNFAMLSRRFGITEQDLKDPCTNINVGAWLYAKNKRQFGDTWRAIGAYNAKSEKKRIRYAWKVQTKLAQLRRPS